MSTMDYEKMDLNDLRKAAKAAGVSESGNRSQLIARLTKLSQEPAKEEVVKSPEPKDETTKTEADKEERAKTDPATEIIDPATPAPSPPVVNEGKKRGYRIKYKPQSGQTLSLAGLIVPADGVVFDEPNHEYESFVPYFLSRTEVE